MIRFSFRLKCIYFHVNFVVYDVLTGKIERRLYIRNNHYGSGRERCVRDVSWHPFDNYIISTSVKFSIDRSINQIIFAFFLFQWDNQRAHVRWTYKQSNPSEPYLSPPTDNRLPITCNTLQRKSTDVSGGSSIDLNDDDNDSDSLFD